MLTLRLSTSFLDLTPDTSVSVSGVSPIFDRDRIQRSFSYPIRLPATAHNQSVLGYPTRLDAARTRKYQDATLLLDGLEYERGILVLTAITNRTIELTFQNNPLDVVEQMKRKKLQEDLTLTVNAADPYRPEIFLTAGLDPNDLGTQSLFLGINANTYIQADSDPTNIVDLINADYTGLASLVDYDTDDPTQYILTIKIDTSVNASITIDFYPDTFVSGYKYFALSSADTTAVDAVIDDWKTHVAATNATPTTHAYPPVYAPLFYDNRNTNWKNVVNYVAPDGTYPHIGRDIYDGDGWAHTFVPMPKLDYVVEEIFEALGITEVLGSFFEDSDIATLLVYNLRAVDTNLSPWQFFADFEEDPDVGVPPQTYHGYPASFDLADHLPDSTFYDFIERLARTFPLVIDIKRNAVYIDDVNTLLDKDVIDLTEYSDPEYSAEISTTGGYRLTYDRQDTPEINDNYLYDIIEEEDDLDPIELEAGFFSQYWQDLQDPLDADGRAWRLPYEQGVGKSALGKVDNDNPFKLLFLFDDEDSLGNTYPYASYWQLDRVGAPTGVYSMEWGRVYGLYSQWWSRFIRLLSGDTIEVLVYLPPWKLIELRQNITAPIQIQHPEGTILGHIRKFQFKADLRSSGRIAVQITLAKL